jgi:hypothetical protein
MAVLDKTIATKQENYKYVAIWVGITSITLLASDDIKKYTLSPGLIRS